MHLRWIKTGLLVAIAALLASCMDDTTDEPVVWGEVDPAFTRALTQYENWGKSCEPGNPAREASIKAGVTLFKVDALTCQYQRLTAADTEEQDLESVVEIAGRLYAMTGDSAWRNVGQCGLSHETRMNLRFGSVAKSGERMLEPTTQSPTFPEQFYGRVSDFYSCYDDYFYGRQPIE